ncbi:MAG: relaxase/mobilization nuclease domain-containing protein [Chitinophagaceae bacterium]
MKHGRKNNYPDFHQQSTQLQCEKVQKGAAECLYAGNFLKDAASLNFHEKLNHFNRLNDLNTRAKSNTLHISLNFDPSEKLGPEKLVEIAASYMDKIGFEQQPYLVYVHRDAGHPHIHIVTTLIQEDGARIATQNMGKNQSQIARKEIEEAFGLIKASGKNKGVADAEENSAQKILYGKTDTKRSISAVLNKVVNRYNYSSLHELNAVLKLYNIATDGGTEGSRMHKNQGLTYRILDDNGKKVGVPIKASSIHFKPTLKYLETQFAKGEQTKPPFRQKLKTAIDFTMHQRPGSLAHIIQRLKDEKISVAL